ncbi:hypothetical protein JTE90_023548 [Oedothorax gibbosus]|uniref:Uncharacterized protein n=1 Tax=Oedothorax gibbosus TaxID=931172 RepID=A0AAV6TRC8_9ARAC|nr:hypothetical protein JTE90_023548 [Oedothorax gibbosus]
MAGMKEKAKDCHAKPAQIFAEGVGNLPSTTKCRMPLEETAKRTFRNMKRKNLPPTPATLSELVIEGDLTTSGGKDSKRKPFRPSRRNGLSLHLRIDKPMFPSKLWNVHKSTLKGEDRINKQVEGWNNRFASIVGHDHPDIWVLILKMSMELSVDETKLVQLSLGVTQVKRKRKFFVALQGRHGSNPYAFNTGIAFS